MIISKTRDAEWQARFDGLPSFVLPDTAVLVVVPHPDDETLGAGALLWTLRQSGVPVRIVAATDGENAYDTSPEERRALAVTREEEQRDALHELGVSPDCIHRLRRKDSSLHLEEAALTAQLMEIAQEGSVLLAPWSGDFHPDHEACARAASTVARAKKLPLISYFFWTWHRGTPDLLVDLPLRRLNASADAIEAKDRALKKHSSQLYRKDGEPILPKRLLGPASWPFEVFLV